MGKLDADQPVVCPYCEAPQSDDWAMSCAHLVARGCPWVWTWEPAATLQQLVKLASDLGINVAKLAGKKLRCWVEDDQELVWWNPEFASEDREYRVQGKYEMTYRWGFISPESRDAVTHDLETLTSGLHDAISKRGSRR